MVYSVFNYKQLQIKLQQLSDIKVNKQLVRGPDCMHKTYPYPYLIGVHSKFIMYNHLLIIRGVVNAPRLTDVDIATKGAKPTK